MYMMLDLNIWKIKNCEYIQVSGGLDKRSPTVYNMVAFIVGQKLTI